MNAIGKNHFKWGHQVHFTIYPSPTFPSTLSDFMHAQENCEFQFQMDIWNLNFWFSDHSDIGVRWWNWKKRPPKLSKNKMFVFGLCSISDDWLSDLSYKSHQKCENNGCQIILLHFWKLSLLRWLSQSSEVESNPEMSISCFGVTFIVEGMLKCPPTMNITPKKNQMLIFRLCLTSDDQPSNPSYKSHQKCENNGCQIILLHF